MGDPRSQKCDSDLGEDETSLLRTSRVGWSLGNTKAFKKGEIRKVHVGMPSGVFGYIVLLGS